MESYTPDQKIDITKDICPMTFVKTKLKLETMESGQILEVVLREGEPLINVPRSIKEEGHKIIELNKLELDNEKDLNFYKLLIERR
ncbi:MAG: sulfurtransferase TusA family protein [Candidatus Dadabacteria bacterium]|nr:sulfurtransferase TusA family protein [Candidatus Dadabacteria bacterium]